MKLFDKGLVCVLLTAICLCGSSCTGGAAEETSPTATETPVTETIETSFESETSEANEEERDIYMASEDLDFSDFVFIGDSRTVGMAMYFDMDTIAEVGVGISFALSHYDEIIELRDKNIVFNLGVNDLNHIDEYIEFYQRLPEEFTFGNKVYVVSVNPTSGEYDSMNADIDAFNVSLADTLPSTIKWIDTCSLLREEGFYSSDGLHYDKDTYILIAELIYNNVMLYQSLGY